MRTPALLVAALALLPASPIVAQKKPAPTPPPAAKPSTAPAGKVTLQDRVLAVVDEDPILASDVERIIKLGLQKPNPGESDEAFRGRVLNALIDERLRFHEIDRYGLEQVPVEDVEKEVAKVRANFKDEAAFQKALREVGLDLKGLRQLMARQLLVLTSVDERMGPRVFVSIDDITRYYRDVLTPEMQKKGVPVPPLEDVREDIREVLKQERLTEELKRWTGELRRQANIVVYSNQPAGAPLPPVVKRIEAPAKKGETKSEPPKKGKPPV